jgi:AcrR family transcriptional regulator
MNVVHPGRTHRGSYHHGDLANALTAAATQMAREGGPEAVVLREAARKVGVSATAAYRHFAGHGDLIHAVKECALDDLAGAMRAELAATAALPDRPAEVVRRLRAIGTGYLRFALAEPGLFRTAFTRFDSSGEPAPGGHPPAGMADSLAFQLLAETLDQLVEAGLMRPERRAHAEIFAWSTTHGLAMLLLDGPLAALPPDLRDDVIRRSLEGILDGLVSATSEFPLH